MRTDETRIIKSIAVRFEFVRQLRFVFRVIAVRRLSFTITPVQERIRITKRDMKVERGAIDPRGSLRMGHLFYL